MAEQTIDLSIEEVIKKMDIIERKADSSIKGYFYQIHLTLKQVLNSDFEKTEYYIEKIEDILQREDLIKEEGKINIIQVKHHETKTTDSKYTEPLLYFYKSFLIAKQAGKSEVFKFTLMKYDHSEDKNARRILEAGLVSKAEKNIQLQGEIETLISDINIDRYTLEQEFLSGCNIITTSNLQSTIQDNINAIQLIFAEDTYKAKLAKEFYSLAWTYVVDNFAVEDFYLTKKLLKDLFIQRADQIEEYVVDNRWIMMERSLTSLGRDIKDVRVGITTIKDGINEIKEASRVNVTNKVHSFLSALIDDLKEEVNDDEYDEEVNEVEVLCDELLTMLDEIKDTILNQIQQGDEQKYYFLISLIPVPINKEEFLEDQISYFYKHKHEIETFLRRLLKIFFYKKHIEKTVIKCIEIFEFIGNGIWMLKEKNNNKEYYVNLLGGEDKTKRASGLNTLMKKYIYSYDNNFPDLIFFKGSKKGNISKIDISKGEIKNIKQVRRRIDKKDQDLFIKCINCLKEDEYNNYLDCKNIFKLGCEIESWKP